MRLLRWLSFVFPILILVMIEFAGGIETNYNAECFEILEMLARIEGFDYSNISFAKMLFGDEKINFEIKTWRGNCYYSIGTLNGKVTIVSNKLFKDATLLAFSDSKTIKYLLRNPSLESFQKAIRTEKIKLKPVGFANKFKFGTASRLGRLFPTNFTPETSNETSQIPQEEDFDNDGVPNSLDNCDPYVLRNQTGDSLARIFYRTCSRYGLIEEEYSGNAPYDDIYDYVLSNGCGLKESDGGIRYYKKGSIYIENVTYSPPEMHETMSGGIFTQSNVVSKCIEYYTDYCLDNETLVEYYYEPPRRISHPNFGVLDLPGQIKNETHKCLFGCENGKCILKDVDSPENDPCISGKCGFQPEVRGKYYHYKTLDYGDLGKKIISLKTGKSINNLSEEDEFSDICIDESTLKEYYLTTETKIGLSGILEDSPAVKEENYSCKCDNGRCRIAGDVKIVDVQPVQVVYGAPLIKGKGTAFRVIVDSTFSNRVFVEFELHLPKNEWNYSGEEKWRILIPNARRFEIILPYNSGKLISPTTPRLPSGWSAPPVHNVDVEYIDAPRPIADRVSFTVVANVTEYEYDINPADNVFTRQNIEVITTKPFRIMYFVHVPNSSYIDTTNDIIKCSVQNESLCKHGSDIGLKDMWQNIFDIAKNSTEYLLGVAPIADEKIKFGINFSVNVVSNYSSFKDYLHNLYEIATLWGYDAAITIDPCDRCGMTFRNGDVACTIGGAPGTPPQIIGHELLSHKISEFYEECYSCMPSNNGSKVDCSACVASEGFWVNRWEPYEEGRYINGKINGTEYYATSLTTEKIWQRLDDLWEYGDPSKKLPGGYLRLIEKFNNTNDPPILIVSGNVYRNGSAEFDKFFKIIEGHADIEPGTLGSYSIVFLDSEGKILSRYGFDPSFELFTYDDIIQTDSYPFVFKILWDNKTSVIELRHGNEVLARKFVSRNKPEILITSPEKGTVFKENEPIVIKWNASDADGDELVFFVGLTQDKVNWAPLASNLKNNEYLLSTNYLNRGTYWIKVMATDGVNTAEDISEFFVDIPAIEQEVQKEVCGNNFCNLRFENTLTCPEDCPSGIRDNICDMIKDNRLDPDCKEGFDPDDTVIYEKKITEEHRKSNFLVYGIILLVAIIIFGIFIGVYKLIQKIKKVKK